MIRGYDKGANISLLNIMYHKPELIIEEDDAIPSRFPKKKKYTPDSIDIVYKDLDTGEKKLQHIENPEYTYYLAKANYVDGEDYNRMYLDRNEVVPVTCLYRELKKDIATKLGRLDQYNDNIRSGNASLNEKLFLHPRVFRADMNIEDYYRFMFGKLYKNTPFIPDKLFFDIEADTIDLHGAFPEPGECPVNSCSLVDEKSKTGYLLLLDDPKNKEQIDKFKSTSGMTAKLKEFIRKAVGGWKQEIRFGLNEFEYKIIFFAEEIQLIHAIFNIINSSKPDFALAWNMAFDVPYLIARIYNLGYDPCEIVCHKDFPVKNLFYYIDRNADKFEERGDYAKIPSYTVYIDQLILYASRRKGQRQLSGFKLDYIGETVAKVRKLDYSHITTNIAKLPYLDFLTFAFYNMMDSIVQKCIEVKTGDVDFLYNKCMMNNTRYQKAHRQTVYLINRAIKEFDKEGKVMGCNTNKSNSKSSFAGAFVADPLHVSEKPKQTLNGVPINLLLNLNDFDYAALYPSIIEENNMAANTMVGKLIFPEPVDRIENRFNNNYFDRSVWFIEDYVSGNILDFCYRYLRFGSYLEVYRDVIEYYSQITNPYVIARPYDVNGTLIMAVSLSDKTESRVMAIVDESEQRQMAYRIEIHPGEEQ